MFFDGDRQRGYVKTGWNEFCFEDVFARFKADTSVSEESKVSSPAVFSITAFSAVSGTPGTGTRPIRC